MNDRPRRSPDTGAADAWDSRSRCMSSPVRRRGCKDHDTLTRFTTGRRHAPARRRPGRADLGRERRVTLCGAGLVVRAAGGRCAFPAAFQLAPHPPYFAPVREPAGVQIPAVCVVRRRRRSSSSRALQLVLPRREWQLRRRADLLQLHEVFTQAFEPGADRVRVRAGVVRASLILHHIEHHRDAVACLAERAPWLPSPRC